MRFARKSLRHYSEMIGYSPRLEEMCSSSVMEACEELVRRAEESGIADPIELSLDYKGETIVVDIAYNGRIPLNPLKTKDYEIPDAGRELDDIDMDTLWLHLIKQRMDRVRFIVRGSRHILRLVKYRREEGKEKRAWIMAIRPELSRNVILHLENTEEEHPCATLQAPGTGVLRLGPSETFLVRNMDGKTSFHDLYMAHIDALGLTSPEILAGLYEQLETMGMLAAPETDRENSRIQRLLKRVINPSITIPNADRVVTAAHRRTRFLFSSLGLGALLAIGLSGAVPFWEHYTRFAQVMSGLEETLLNSPHLILPVYLLTLVHISLHELAHGVACKHYGGNVPRLGIMFYLGSFIFYCDTTAAWNFPQKKHRILVSLSGPIVSFSIMGMGLWAAGHYAGTGSLWESVFLIFSLYNFFMLVMNFNPFIKMDAYYMLLDYTGIPNLRERSFRFLERKLLGWLDIGSEKHTKVTLGERRIFWWYGMAGSLTSLLFLAIPFYQFTYIFRTESITGGKLIFATLIGGLLIVRLGNSAFREIKAIRYREYVIQ